MPRGRGKKEDPAVPLPPDEDEATSTAVALPEDDFLASLREELTHTQQATVARAEEDPSRRASLNRRLLQDLWEVHNIFEDISVHLTLEPSQTLFATFTEFPQKWAFKDSFDFGAVQVMELKDRAPSWLGSALKIWYYPDAKGHSHLRMIFEWCEGETYHKYSGWMRVIRQAVLYDEALEEVSLGDLHKSLKDLVVSWYSSHLKADPTVLTEHLKEHYPKGATETKESYRA